jgi:hypothetical protein
MSHARAQRYQKASEVADALEAYVSGALVGSESRAIALVANLAGVLALLVLLFSAAMMTAMAPSMRELGVASYFYTTFFVVGAGLTIVHWRTRGRYRLGVIVLGLAVTTLLLGIGNAFAGFDRVLMAVDGEVVSKGTTEGFRLLLLGVREAFGNIAPSSTFCAVLLFLLALATRANARWHDRRAASSAAPARGHPSGSRADDLARYRTS